MAKKPDFLLYRVYDLQLGQFVSLSPTGGRTMPRRVFTTRATAQRAINLSADPERYEIRTGKWVEVQDAK